IGKSGRDGHGRGGEGRSGQGEQEHEEECTAHGFSMERDGSISLRQAAPVRTSRSDQGPVHAIFAFCRAGLPKRTRASRPAKSPTASASWARPSRSALASGRKAATRTTSPLLPRSSDHVPRTRPSTSTTGEIQPAFLNTFL